MPSDVNGLRVDTLSNWRAAAGNYVPLDGEFVFVSDIGMLVQGDGSDVDTSTNLGLLPGAPNTVTGNHTITNYEGTINVNTASATITLPSATGSGRKVTVRKISDSSGTVTISRAGSDTITSGSLSSVTLTSEGDYWTLEDVASGRWELVSGYEFIDDTFDVKKYSDGTIYQSIRTTLSNSASGTADLSLSETLMSTSDFVFCGGQIQRNSSSESSQNEWRILVQILNTSTLRVSFIASSSADDPAIVWVIGRWY